MRGEPINLDVALSEWGQLKEPFQAIYGYVQAGDVAQWWVDHYPRLFAPNLRLFLGDTEVNAGLSETLRTEPERFWYYNNGITALCDSIEKKPIGGATHDHALFECHGVSVVNGVQTVGAIATASQAHQLEVSRARVMVRFIALGGAPENLASLVTQFTNTQNRIEKRDFVALDPEQERLKTELQIERVDYVFKSGDRVSTGRDGFDLAEASVALACAQDDVALAVQAKREISKLWEDISKPPYRTLFNPSLTGPRLWQLVERLRFIDGILHERQRTLVGRDRGYAVHGNRFVAWLAMQRWPQQQADKTAATAIVDRSLSQTVSAGNALFPETYLASLFKNAAKCRRLANVATTGV
jgi:hypothetical protein